jgi:hypothetical protein
MERTVLVFPVKPGMNREQASAITEMFRARPSEYRESRSNLGITLERAYPPSSPPRRSGHAATS